MVQCATSEILPSSPFSAGVKDPYITTYERILYSIWVEKFIYLRDSAKKKIQILFITRCKSQILFRLLVHCCVKSLYIKRFAISKVLSCLRLHLSAVNIHTNLFNHGMGLKVCQVFVRLSGVKRNTSFNIFNAKCTKYWHNLWQVSVKAKPVSKITWKKGFVSWGNCSAFILVEFWLIS